MCCSRQEWAEKALAQLRQCFVAQDYPSNIIDIQFERVLQLNRRDLIFSSKAEKQTNSKYRRGLLVTYHANNPPLRKWICQVMKDTLHVDPVCKTLFPEIPIVTRQPKNVKSIAVHARHWLYSARASPGSVTNPGPGWNVTHRHSARCQACDRMTVTNKFYCYPTMRTYTIRSKTIFQCDQSWCIYYAQCS